MVFLKFDDSVVNHAAPLLRNEVEHTNLFGVVVGEIRSTWEVLGNSFRILSADHGSSFSIHSDKGYENRLTLLEK